MVTPHDLIVRNVFVSCVLVGLLARVTTRVGPYVGPNEPAKTQTNDQPMNQSERKGPVRLYISLVLSLLACDDVGYAASVTLRWDADNEQDLVGYKIYKRLFPSLDYGSPVFS